MWSEQQCFARNSTGAFQTTSSELSSHALVNGALVLIRIPLNM